MINTTQSKNEQKIYLLEKRERTRKRIAEIKRDLKYIKSSKEKEILEKQLAESEKLEKKITLEIKLL